MPVTPRRKHSSTILSACFALLLMVGAFLLFVRPVSAATGCPGALVYSATTASELDVGWTGRYHDLPVIGWALRMGVTGCAGSTVGSCGQCSISGLINDAGGSNQRCSNDTSIKCTSDAPCVGGGGHCAFFATSPNPVSASGIGACVVNEVTGSVTGTVNIESGALSVALPLRSDLYLGGSFTQPCPTCTGDPVANDNQRGGVCSGGPRSGLTCDANATSPIPDFGTVSFDCPPSLGSFLGSLALSSQAVTTKTDTSTSTLSAANPSCTASGYTSLKCHCDTCNNVTASPCSTNADCPMSGGNPGICGGRRCLAGVNAGAPCSSNTSCPASTCGRPGALTQPNGCNDTTDIPGDGTLCPDTAPVDGEGECVEGPFDPHCAAPEAYRTCSSSGDCPLSGTCLSPNRRCFPGGGVIGTSVSVAGTATPRSGNTSNPENLGSLFCVGSVSSGLTNSNVGFPGLARMSLLGTLTFADEVVIENVPPATTVSSDAGEGDGATPADPVETAVTTSAGGAGGEVTILETTATATPPPGFAFLGNLVQITAPAGTVASPLTLSFLIDSTAAGSETPATVIVRRNGVPVSDCVAVPPAAISPNPCVFLRTLAGDDIQLGVYTSAASDWDLLGTAGPVPTATGPTPTATPTPMATFTPAAPACAALPEICRTPVLGAKAALALTDKSPDDKDQLQWKWASGSTTLKSDFGDPLGTDDYLLCLYDDSGLLTTITIPKGGTCGTKPCWADKPKGFQYKNKLAMPNGITQLQLSEGADGKAKIQVKGKGLNLPTLALDMLVSPVTVQLKPSGGSVCWGSTFSFPPAGKNDAVQFKDKAD